MPRPARSGSGPRWFSESSSRRAAEPDRRQVVWRPGGRSLSRGDRAHVVVVEKGDHDLIVQSLGPTNIELDDEIDVFLTARHGADLEPRAPNESLQILEDRGTRVRVNRDGRPRRLTFDERLAPAKPGEHTQDDRRGGDPFEVVTASQGHADRRHDPDGRGAGEPNDGPAGVQNGPRPDEPDAGHDLARDASGIGACPSP